MSVSGAAVLSRQALGGPGNALGPAVFLQMNANAIVGMSAAAKKMEEAERGRLAALIHIDIDLIEPSVETIIVRHGTRCSHPSTLTLAGGPHTVRSLQRDQLGGRDDRQRHHCKNPPVDDGGRHAQREDT